MRWLVLALALLPTPALAAKATCRDYMEATGADRALMDGFVLGFVAARMEGKSSAEVDAATLRVRELAATFCNSHPDERAINVLGGLGDIATGYVAPR